MRGSTYNRPLYETIASQSDERMRYGAKAPNCRSVNFRIAKTVESLPNYGAGAKKGKLKNGNK